jgi:hypothetical protein
LSVVYARRPDIAYLPRSSKTSVKIKIGFVLPKS